MIQSLQRLYFLLFTYSSMSSYDLGRNLITMTATSNNALNCINYLPITAGTPFTSFISNSYLNSAISSPTVGTSNVLTYDAYISNYDIKDFPDVMKYIFMTRDNSYKFLDRYITQIFGSEDSRDMDLMLLSSEPIMSINDCKKEAATLKYKTNIPHTDINFATYNGDGRINDCYKGSVDETNNMLFHTAHLHDNGKQLITKLYPRIVSEKRKRVIRGILSYLSRTSHRKDIKKVLGKYQASLDLFKTIKLSEIVELNKNNVTFADFCKFLAFQYAQLEGFTKDKEIFTKKDAVLLNGDLEDFIYYKKENPYLLDYIQNRLIELFQMKNDIYYDESSMYFSNKAYNRTYVSNNGIIGLSYSNSKVYVYAGALIFPVGGIYLEDYLDEMSNLGFNLNSNKLLIQDNVSYVKYDAIDYGIDTKKEEALNDFIHRMEIANILTLNKLRNNRS